MHGIYEAFQYFSVHIVAKICNDAFFKFFLEFGTAFACPRETNDEKIWRKTSLLHQRIERRKYFQFREVAGRAENRKNEWLFNFEEVHEFYNTIISPSRGYFQRFHSAW